MLSWRHQHSFSGIFLSLILPLFLVSSFLHTRPNPPVASASISLFIPSQLVFCLHTSATVLHLHSLVSSSPANHLHSRLPTPTFSALAPSCPGSKNSILLSTLFLWPYCFSLLLSQDSHSSLAHPNSITFHHNYVLQACSYFSWLSNVSIASSPPVLVTILPPWQNTI